MSEQTLSRAIPVGILVSISESSPPSRRRRIRKPPLPAPLCRRVVQRNLLIVFGAVGTFALLACAFLAAAAPPAAKAPPVRVAAVAATAALVPDAAIPVPADPEPVRIEPKPEPPLDLQQPLDPPTLEPTVANVPAPAPLPEPPSTVVPAKAPVAAVKLGTQINFVADPPEAFKRAREQNKLVLMIHLSGNFEEKEFT